SVDLGHLDAGVSQHLRDLLQTPRPAPRAADQRRRARVPEVVPAAGSVYAGRNQVLLEPVRLRLLAPAARRSWPEQSERILLAVSRQKFAPAFHDLNGARYERHLSNLAVLRPSALRP